jgi:hypothetical protein
LPTLQGLHTFQPLAFALALSGFCLGYGEWAESILLEAL